MIQVTVYEESYECVKAVRGVDYIKLYDGNGAEIASFEGVSDFSGYTIEGGEWSNPEPTELEKIKEQLSLTQEALNFVLMGGN